MAFCARFEWLPLDGPLSYPRGAVLRQGDAPDVVLSGPLRGRGPLVAFNQSTLGCQPVLGVHPCRKRVRRVVACEVGTRVAGLIAPRREGANFAPPSAALLANHSSRTSACLLCA